MPITDRPFKIRHDNHFVLYDQKNFLDADNRESPSDHTPDDSTPDDGTPENCTPEDGTPDDGTLMMLWYQNDNKTLH